jgi:hypothetical protein
MAEQGFSKLASTALRHNKAPKSSLTPAELAFLKDEFGPARDRMATLATTVGTTGSFLLVLVALLVSFATASGKEADELVAASEEASLLEQRCSEEEPTPDCTARKLQQAQDAVERERDQVSDLTDLNTAQAVAGGAALIGFLLSLGAHLTNPVAGPRTGAHTPAPTRTNGTDDGESSSSSGGGPTNGNQVAAWIEAVDRLKVKRHWIEASLVAQIVGVVAVGYIAYDVLFG